MLFFRSEEQVRLWCDDRGVPVRPIVPMKQLWDLAHLWYSTKLEKDSRRFAPHEVRGALAGIGLVGEFWDPESNAVG